MMELSVVDSEARQSKLDKQRDLLIKKRKQKHAHQVLSLHEKSLKAAVGTAPRSPKTTKHSERTVANEFEQNNYAYDGPQSYNLGNPDLLETPSVQVLRIARNSPQDSNSPTNHNSKSPEPAPANPPRPRTRPSPKPAKMRFSEEPAKQAFHSPIRPMKLPLPASVTDADDQQHLFAADERDRIGFPDTDSRRVSPGSRDTRRTSAPRRPQPPRTNNLVNSKLDESTKTNCVSSSLVQEFTLPSDSSPSWVDDNSQPSDTVSRSTSTIPNSSPCLRLRKNSNQKNGQHKKSSRKGHLKKTRSDESREVEEALTSASDTHVAVGDKISHKSSPLEVSSGEQPDGEGGSGDVPLDLQFRNKVSCRLEAEATSRVRSPKSAGAAHSRLQRRRPRHKADEDKNELPKAEGKEDYRSRPDAPNCPQTVTPNLEDHLLAISTSGGETLEREQDRQQAQPMSDLPQESVSRKTKTTPPSMQTSAEADLPLKHKSEEENNDINHTSTTLGPPDYDKVDRPRKVSREEKTSAGAPLEDISAERAVSNATNLIGENEANSTIPENIVEDHATECETQRDPSGTEDPIEIIESEPVSSLSADTVTMPEELSVTTPKQHQQGVLGPERLQLKLNLSDAVCNAKKKDAFEPEDDIEAFVVRPAPKGTRVRCRISRDKRGVDRGFFPTYFLHLERDDGRRFFLLAARRRRRSTTSNYVISFDATDLSRSSCRLAGKLRANFVGTHFTVYDVPSTQVLQGRMTERSESETVATPGRRSMLSGSIPPSPREAREVAAIIYDPNILGFKGPRKMTVIIPKMDEDGHMMNIYSDNDSCLLLDQWRKKKTYAIMELRNKTPAWNEDTQSYVLNFHGRVTQASVKNFQIVPKADEHTVLMQFGRVSEDIFNMDFEYPLCALQAFGIALSSFDGKLACE